MTPPSPTPDLTSDLTKASALHEAGRLAEASAIYQRILAAHPGNHQALHGLGLITLDLGLPKRALPLLMQCVAAQPANGLYRTSLGLALLREGQAEPAAAAFLDAANRMPHSADPRVLLARALGILKRWGQAHDVLEKTVAAFPDRADAWTAKGNAERILSRPGEAEKSLRRALTLAPGDADTLNNLGVVVRAQGRTEEAIGYYREALVRAPDRALVHANLGNALTELGHTTVAEHHLQRAVELDPSAGEARYNLAVYLTRAERASEALPHFRAALDATPDNASLWTNYGVAQLDTGDTQGATDSYRRAIALQPKNSEAHYNLAWVLLLTGQWPEGWREYEWRWMLPNFSSRKHNFTPPLWDGRALNGTLLLHAEQGLGDAIQFVRYAKQAKALCRHVVVECPRPLTTLLAAVEGIDQIVAAGDALPPFEAHAPFMSLPHILGTTPENVPSAPSYLRAPVPSAPLRLPGNGRRRIGLVWAGSPDNKIDRRRTIPARLFQDMVARTDADFISLQVGPRASEAADLPAGKLVFACEGHVADFKDTAAVVGQLDLILGVDTAVMHLAGALGKPVWMLVPFMPDYRWLLGRDDTPWYPSIRLFRQGKNEAWSSVIARMTAALTDWQPDSV